MRKNAHRSTGQRWVWHAWSLKTNENLWCLCSWVWSLNPWCIWLWVKPLMAARTETWPCCHTFPILPTNMEQNLNIPYMPYEWRGYSLPKNHQQWNDHVNYRGHQCLERQHSGALDQDRGRQDDFPCCTCPILLVIYRIWSLQQTSLAI